MHNAIVVTSINSPNSVIREIAIGAEQNSWKFLVIGDAKSPTDFNCKGAEFYSVERQNHTSFTYARKCPTGHYARKNIGYLLAMIDGADVIVETDDDNHPYPKFWNPRIRKQCVRVVAESGWTNIYRHFSDANIWPRGLPLDEVGRPPIEYTLLEDKPVDCPIQQGLADANPDVDAIYRLVLPLPQNFRDDRRVALGKGVWCPFNSQNTTWWPDAYPLLYLPAHCSFRMCDIWRGFVAQRIAWENGWHIMFHEATVWQERNSHDLMRDFDQEIIGYLNNKRIVESFERLPIKKGAENMPENLQLCYEALMRMNLVGNDELSLLDAWLSDIQNIEVWPKSLNEQQ